MSAVREACVPLHSPSVRIRRGQMADEEHQHGVETQEDPRAREASVRSRPFVIRWFFWFVVVLRGGARAQGPAACRGQ